MRFSELNGAFSILLIKSPVSLMYDWYVVVSGHRNLSMYLDNGSVLELIDEMMGRSGGGVHLCFYVFLAPHTELVLLGPFC